MRTVQILLILRKFLDQKLAPRGSNSSSCHVTALSLRHEIINKSFSFIHGRLLKLEACGAVFSPYTLLTTFEYSVHTTLNSHVDFYGGRKTGEPGEKPS